jgi:ribonuclease Z
VINVTLLGTGSPIPDPNRAGAATLVRAGESVILVDCGRGVLMRLAAAGVLPGMLSALFLTHLHSDHVTDLNDVITTRWAMAPEPNPLTIVGPPGTAALVERTLAMLSDDVGWRLAHHADLSDPPRCDVTELTAGVAWDAQGLLVLAEPTEHRPVHPTVGYRFEHGAAVAALAGDTVPCEGLDRLCAGAGVYVQTVVRPALIELIPSPRLHDVLDYHSSTVQAGETAARAGVRTLVLTHMVPGVAPGSEGDWIADAATVFSGEIIVGHDLLTVTA